MKEKTVSIDKLIPDPKNARKHNSRNKETIVNSLKKFGAARSVVIDADGVVRAGNGTVEAARAAGIEKVRVIETDGKTLIAVQRKDLNGESALAYSLADNRTAELAEWDGQIFYELMDELHNFPLDSIGFEDKELERILSNLKTQSEEAANDPYAEWTGMPECVSEDQTPFRSIVIHFENDEDVQKFAELIGIRITEKTRWSWYPKKEPVKTIDKVWISKEEKKAG